MLVHSTKLTLLLVDCLQAYVQDSCRFMGEARAETIVQQDHLYLLANRESMSVLDLAG